MNLTQSMLLLYLVIPITAISIENKLKMIEKPNDSTNQSLTNEHPSSQAEKTTSGTQESNVEEVVNQVLERKQTIQNLTRLRNRIKQSNQLAYRSLCYCCYYSWWGVSLG